MTHFFFWLCLCNGYWVIAQLPLPHLLLKQQHISCCITCSMVYFGLLIHTFLCVIYFRTSTITSPLIPTKALIFSNAMGVLSAIVVPLNRSTLANWGDWWKPTLRKRKMKRNTSSKWRFNMFNFFLRKGKQYSRGLPPWLDVLANAHATTCRE